MAPTTTTKSRLLPHQGGNADAQPGAGRKKPAAFARVWSVADDLRILEGLAAYVSKHRAPPRRSELHAALAGRNLDKPKFTVIEIYEKVRSLKNRYLYRRSRSARRVAPGGDEARRYLYRRSRSAGSVAPGGDEARKYELAKAIWGKEMESSLAQPKVVKKEDMRVRRGSEEMRSLYPNLAAVVERIFSGEDRDLLGPVLKRAFEFMDDDEAEEWDAKVKKRRVLEIKMRKGRATVRDKVVDALLKSMD